MLASVLQLELDTTNFLEWCGVFFLILWACRFVLIMLRQFAPRGWALDFAYFLLLKSVRGRVAGEAVLCRYLREQAHAHAVKVQQWESFFSQLKDSSRGVYTVPEEGQNSFYTWAEISPKAPAYLSREQGQ